MTYMRLHATTKQSYINKAPEIVAPPDEVTVLALCTEVVRQRVHL